MFVVKNNTNVWFVSSLLLGGCLLSFILGRWSGTKSEQAVLVEGRDEVAVQGNSSFSDTKREASLRFDEPGERQERRREISVGDRSFGAGLQRLKLDLIELAETDPQRAMEIAGQATFEVDRRNLSLAAIEGWARSDASAALDEALRVVDREQREMAIFSVLKGSAIDPMQGRSSLLKLEKSGVLSSEALGRARLAFVGALSLEGFFSEAVEYAQGEANSSQRTALMNAGFAQWGRYEPETAMHAVMEIDSVTDREQAFSAVISSWVGVDPAGLAEFSEQLPSGKQRISTMEQALQNWVAADPVGASEWLDARGSAPELDAGILALTRHPYLAEQSPLVAVSWAESLWDPGLRSGALALIVKQWAATNRGAAVEYVRSSRDFDLAERQELLSLFGETKEFGIDGPLR